MTDPTATAVHLRQHAKISGKPVLASWMGGEAVEAGRQILNQAGIPCYEYPDTAARVFTLMWGSSYNLQGLYETPNEPVNSETATNARESGGDHRRRPPSGPDRAHRSRIEAAARAGYGIPTVPSGRHRHHGGGRPWPLAAELGYPARS